jgi:hypothetical protein
MVEYPPSPPPVLIQTHLILELLIIAFDALAPSAPLKPLVTARAQEDKALVAESSR